MNYRDILTDILNRHGKLTPEIVVEEARPTDSPLHGVIFDKNVPEAAEAYYRENARKTIQSVRVIVQHNDAERRSVRAFLAVPSTEEKYVYEPIAVVVNDVDKFAMVRLEAARRLREAESAVEDLDALAHGTANEQRSRKVKVAIKTARRELERVV